MLSNIGATLKRKVKQTKYDRQKRRLAGSGVSCPICGANFREFATYGLNKRPNARCPGCRSLERDRLLWVYLQRRTGLLNPTAGIDQKIRLLHFAPEAHLYKQFATATHIDYTPVDFSPEKFADLVGSQGVEAAPAVVQGDILGLEFASSSFDFLICNHVLEHIEDDRQALSELFRVLAPGGSAIVMVPINYFDLPANHPASITYENAKPDVVHRPDFPASVLHSIWSGTWNALAVFKAAV